MLAAPAEVIETFRTLRVALRLPSGVPQVIAVISADGGDKGESPGEVIRVQGPYGG